MNTSEQIKELERQISFRKGETIGARKVAKGIADVLQGLKAKHDGGELECPDDPEAAIALVLSSLRRVHDVATRVADSSMVEMFRAEGRLQGFTAATATGPVSSQEANNIGDGDDSGQSVSEAPEASQAQQSSAP